MREKGERELERATAELRRPVRLDESFDQRVMSAVRALPRHRFGRWARALRPRTVTVSPVFSGIAATLLFAFALSAGHMIGSASRAAEADLDPVAVTRDAHAAEAEQGVQFVLVAPDARKVAVVGDFNDWDATHTGFQAEHRGGGVWSVTAVVPPGHHRYSFVVDDSLWVVDPAAPRAVDDDYGRPNSALVIGGDTEP